jgi:hypothetical protein
LHATVLAVLPSFCVTTNVFQWSQHDEILDSIVRLVLVQMMYVPALG